MIKIEYKLQNLNDAPLLLGANNKHFNLLEDHLNVNLNLLGSTIKINARDSQSARMTSAIIKQILNLIHQGIKVHSSDFLEAIKMAKDNKLDYFTHLYDKTLIYDNHGTPIHAKSYGQMKYIQSVKHNTITFGIGPAGTGKTFLAVVMAVRELKAGKVDKIILTRPAVEAGEKLGFLPGDLKDKIDPYLRPIYDALYSIIGSNHTQDLLNNGVIEIAPLAYMRGRTLNSSFVILDEAQNTTNMQMKMFLTRLGFNSKMIVNGDISQIDLPRNKHSGLVESQYILNHVKSINFVKFSSKDVVRHPVVARIIKAYDKYNQKLAKN